MYAEDTPVPTLTVLGSPRATLAAALLGFFMITLDAVAVTVALPSMARDLSAGMTGLQWVVDGYTLMFAALLLSAGALSDRVGARRAFGAGLAVFLVASLACALAPSHGWLVAARFGQGAAAAMMMPSSMALIRQAYPDSTRRGRAIAMWAMGGAAAATSGPIIGGVLTMVSWRWIFLLNLPVGLVALILLARAAKSPQRQVPLDWAGQSSGVVAMAAITFGAIEAGAGGLDDPRVMAAFLLAGVAGVAFIVSQRRGEHAMVPPQLFENRNAVLAMAVGFAFMVGYFGLPFLMSLYLQQQRGLSPLATGLSFLPMMLMGVLLTPFSARAVERFGARALIITGMASMATGLLGLSAMPTDTPVVVLSLWMVMVGLAGPLVAPPITTVLLDCVPAALVGTASGVYNTSRQVGGALAVATFGALLNQSTSFEAGFRQSLWLAAFVAVATAVACVWLQTPPRQRPEPEPA